MSVQQIIFGLLEFFVTINGLRCTLLEVTGPEKMPHGLISLYSQFYLESGRYRYAFVR